MSGSNILFIVEQVYALQAVAVTMAVAMAAASIKHLGADYYIYPRTEAPLKDMHRHACAWVCVCMHAWVYIHTCMCICRHIYLWACIHMGVPTQTLMHGGSIILKHWYVVKNTGSDRDRESPRKV